MVMALAQNNVTVKGDLAITDSGAGIYIGGGESKVVVKGKLILTM